MTARMKATLLRTTLAFGLAFLALPAVAQATHHGLPDLHTQITLLTAGAEPSPLAPGAPGLDPAQAGAHPNFRIVARFCGDNCTNEQNAAPIEDFIVRLPPGMLGNPAEIPTCPEPLFLAVACPPETKLGDTVTLAGQNGNTSSLVTVLSPLFNVETLGLAPAELGTGILPSTPPGPLPVRVTLDSSTENPSDPSDGDYSVDAAVSEIPRTLNGLPATVFQIDTLLYGQVGTHPFFVNPTSCGEKKIEIAVRSFSTPEDETIARTGDPGYGSAYEIKNCGAVPFNLGVSATPETKDGVPTEKAGAPSGYTVKLEYPDYTDSDIWDSALKNAVVKLPKGVSLAAGGGIGLQSCSAEQFGVLSYGDVSTPAQVNGDPAKCPAGSAIGDVSVETPVLKNPTGSDAAQPDLTGKAYFGPATAPGQPTADTPWKLFLLLEGFGLRVKLVGDVTLSDDGQITTTFLNQPQVPFSSLTLHTNDEDAANGQFAPLANPKECGNYKIEADFTGYSGAPSHSPHDPPLSSESSFNISSDGAGAPCPSPRPFNPTVLDASATPTQAGAHSVSHLLIDRPDGDQLMQKLNLNLPMGALGSLTAVPLCPQSQVPTGNCSEESKVGIIRTTVGTGDGLLQVSGSLYVGEPIVGGDAASFVIKIPAKVGPIDLGTVVLVNRVVLRPDDQGLTVLSPDIPLSFGGIPLPVRKIDITVNRPEFFLNPSGCDQRFFVATFKGDEGADATSSFPAQATGCDKVAFAPKIHMITGAKGLTGAGKHPPLRAIVTQERGEAAIAKARVVVPDIVRPNVPQFNKPGGLCNDAQLASRTCPPLSEVGSAKVVTPLLPFALKGPVYIVQTAASPLPKLAVFLRGGGLEVQLSARNGFQGIKILNTFDFVPDVPQSYFELDIKGGSNGILNAFNDLCKIRTLPTVDSTFTGWNGKTFNEKPKIEVNGCSSASSAGGASLSTSSVKMSSGGVVSLKVRCLSKRSRCKGRLSIVTASAVSTSKRRKVKIGSKSFSIPAGKSRAVKVKLSRKGKSLVRSKRHLKVRVTLKVGSKTHRKTITIRR